MPMSRSSRAVRVWRRCGAVVVFGTLAENEMPLCRAMLTLARAEAAGCY